MQDQLEREDNRLKIILWENEDLGPFLNFPEGKSTPKLTCKTDDVFPKLRKIFS
ncbi:hypothetical protein DVH24_016853 [Malus domestica]|uniref:Uncharacterized protein n=1 Tax=Malus domestica TaxID=3750 RepID=A0A498HXW9_MALDO|nr:hypothetical protein DVH24_016853 [Malus domestica]